MVNIMVNTLPCDVAHLLEFRTKTGTFMARYIRRSVCGFAQRRLFLAVLIYRQTTIPVGLKRSMNIRIRTTIKWKLILIAKRGLQSACMWYNRKRVLSLLLKNCLLKSKLYGSSFHLIYLSAGNTVERI